MNLEENDENILEDPLQETNVFMDTRCLWKIYACEEMFMTHRD